MSNTSETKTRLFATKEELSKNQFLNRLMKDVEENYQMFGTFIAVTKAKHPQYNGIYFVCGYDKLKVLDDNNDIEEIYKQQGKNNRFRLDLHVTKVTDQSAFAVYRKVMKNCLYTSTMRALFNKFFISFDDPTMTFPVDYCDNAIALYKAYREMPTHENEEAIRKYLTSKGETEPAKPKLSEKRSRKKDPKNKLKKIEDLIGNCDKIYRAVVEKDELGRFEKALSARPEILFHTMPSKDRTTVLYDGFYHEDVDEMLLKIRFKNCFNYSVEDLKEQYKETFCAFGVEYFDLPELFARAEEANVPMCVDTTRLYFNVDKNFHPEENESGYTVAFPLSFHREVHAILQDMAREARNYQILSDLDKKRFSKATGQTAQIIPKHNLNPDTTR